MEERLEVLDRGMSQRWTVSTTAAHTGSSLRPRRDVGEEASPQRPSSSGRLLLVGQRRAEVVDDLVGVAGEAVQRMDVRPDVGRQEQRGEVIGLAVLGVEPATPLVRRPEAGVGDAGAVQLPSDAQRMPAGVITSVSWRACEGRSAGRIPARVGSPNTSAR